MVASKMACSTALRLEPGGASRGVAGGSVGEFVIHSVDRHLTGLDCLEETAGGFVGEFSEAVLVGDSDRVVGIAADDRRGNLRVDKRCDHFGDAEEAVSCDAADHLVVGVV